MASSIGVSSGSNSFLANRVTMLRIVVTTTEGGRGAAEQRSEPRGHRYRDAPIRRTIHAVETR